jgi:peptide/nickel transport system substrate-binding protein/oligopeptide transport system substrate-binding protein
VISLTIPRLAAAPLALALLAACNGDSDRPIEVLAIGDKSETYASGARLPLAAQLLRSATAEGLVAFDAQGRVVPALADRWIVTDQGLSFVFRLRDGTWADGSAITAETARTSLAQAIAAQRGTPLGLDLAPIAEVRTMAGRVIEIRLAQPMPDLLQLLAQPELGLLRGGRGAGPMKLLEATRKEGLAVLRPIAPEDRGAAQDESWPDRVRRLQLGALPPGLAIAMFNRGDADVVLGGGIEDFPRLDAEGVSRGAIRLDPVAGLLGLAVVHADGFLSLPENREALAMALDREGFANALNLGGWTATTRVVNPGLAGDDGTISERWLGRNLADRRALAASRVAAWRAAKGDPAPLRIALPAGSGADLLFERLAGDFKAIGLDSRRVNEKAEADLWLVDRVARYARAPWFLNQLSCAAARGLCSSAADRLVADARSEPDPALRAELLSSAEAELTRVNSFLPLGVPIRWSLVSGDATGFSVNRLNVHPLMPMALRPR